MPAFHPNAAQYPLHLGGQVFGLRRDTRSRDTRDPQSLIVLYSVSADTQPIAMAELNLDESRRWSDLLSGADEGYLRLPPYAYCWLQAVNTQ